VIVYENSKSGFLDDAFKKDIDDVILSAYKARTGRSVARAEIQSWRESLMAVAKVLNHESIAADCRVGIEYGIPQTSKRIDFILSGASGAQADQLVIIELKQWTAARPTGKDGIVSTRFGHGDAEVSHPSYQAWSYASLLENFNEAIADGDVGLHPCAYLHNYVEDGALTDARYAHYLELAPVFLKGEREKEKLREFIRQHVRYGDRRSLLFRIDNGRIRPSKRLVDSLTGMLAGKQEFVLVDDQKVVYEAALDLVSRASDSAKQVIIVEGGPGTGKSVVAINLLVTLTQRRLVTKYVTKNAAPRKVFESVLAGTHRRSQISNLFSGSGDFTDTRANVFDALVVDEAHRLNAKSGLYANLGENQIHELISSAKCSIFFLDEDQRVTFKDIGEKAEIRRFAQIAGAKVTVLNLASQFRCNGSDGYLAWLDNTLGIRSTANDLLDAQEFDFQVFDSPELLRREIVRKNAANNKARMVAGYCWDWRSKKDSSARDVVVSEYGFGMQWNLTKDGGLWMVAPDSVNEIGCIHTCQGLEVDYIGVVVGPDLVVDGDKIVTRPERRSKHDKSLSGFKKLFRENPTEARQKADLIIRNTYRTLMTRGIKGCYVYFTDKATEDWFRSRLKSVPTNLALRKVAEPPAAYENETSADPSD
jgi:uncharacterized protein